jgi:DNA-directed RNA polymerase subunit beta'
VVALQAKVKVRVERMVQGEVRRKVIETTVGRLLFNNAIPQDLGLVDRSNADNIFQLEIDRLVLKKDLGKIVDKCYRKHGPTVTSEVLDRIKKLGFEYSTRGGITVGFQDITVPKEKWSCCKRLRTRSSRSTTCSAPAFSPMRNASSAS